MIKKEKMFQNQDTVRKDLEKIHELTDSVGLNRNMGNLFVSELRIISRNIPSSNDVDSTHPDARSIRKAKLLGLI